MRILFVLNTVALYGATRSAIDLACGLKRLGQEIYFFIPKESRMDERHALKNEMDKYGKEDIFKPYIEEGMTVVEFGSGGGYLLERICAKEKIGIEINDKARETAKARGVNTVKNISDIPDAYADIIISTRD